MSMGLNKQLKAHFSVLAEEFHTGNLMMLSVSKLYSTSSKFPTLYVHSGPHLE
jgi:hypothetical protein